MTDRRFQRFSTWAHELLHSVTFFVNLDRRYNSYILYVRYCRALFYINLYIKKIKQLLKR
ncbi:hypothetical protein Hanom_Chr11g00985181 [Helianthus anomalus]